MIIHGDSLHALKDLPDNYVDSIVTDPPYGLKFMGKKWDYDVPSVDLWREAYRVLKPGGHLLSFGGTRTYHRMAVAIEDAGFEIRDQVQWIYGSGFPKNHDVSKGIDKQAGITEWKETIPNPAARPGNGKDASTSTGWAKPQRPPKPIVETDYAKQWQGWGTALKPANEPICLARKPLEKGLTVAKNVQKWGCGALNIDESRIAASAEDIKKTNRPNHVGNFDWSHECTTAFKLGQGADISQGRFPANILFGCRCIMWHPELYPDKKNIHEAECPVGMLDEQSGVLKTGGAQRGSKIKSTGKSIFGIGNDGVARGAHIETDTYGASRFFYVAKASKRERGEGNVHPTIKPLKLMEYLIKLVTPPTGIVLDPFCGSGSTGVAATRLGFGFIGIEREKEYVDIAEKRIKGAS